MPDTPFAVSRFQNRNGAISWRVSGRLHGLRIRKNFKTREEARAEKAALEIKALQSANGARAATTFLTDDQLREAESAFRRLGTSPHSLTFYLDHALTTYREPARQQPLADAVTAYLAAIGSPSVHGQRQPGFIRALRGQFVEPQALSSANDSARNLFGRQRQGVIFAHQAFRQPVRPA